MENNCIIEELEEKLRKAMLNSDIETLDKLIADSLVFTLPTGDIADKQMDLNAHRSGIQKLYKLSPSEQLIKCYENFVIVTVKMELEGLFNNNSISGRYSYTRVWTKTQEVWQVVAGHVSQILQ